TNINLEQAIRDKTFRSDLYYRLNVVKLHIPPLRDRREDIPLLANYFLRKFTRRSSPHHDGFTSQALEALKEYTWPGNVRQLQNFVEKLVILCVDGYQDDTFEELYANLLNYSLIREREAVPERLPLNRYVHGSPRDDEERTIRKALEESRFSKTLAAQRLGVSRTTLWRKLREMGVNRPNPGK
ncbi:MAG: sigma 54-interacting transcriptional regulator, partial [Deltaproteobacteria bacterium]|nr:sigma 54-interacting transcriptional regulator [Deltaproteobacteria bacterium]